MTVELAVAALLAPYAVASTVGLLWRVRLLRGWKVALVVGAVSYPAVVIVATVGRARSYDDVITFVVLGLLSWATIGFGLLTWLVWDGQIGRGGSTWVTVYPIGLWSRQGLPTMGAAVTIWLGSLPWMFVPGPWRIVLALLDGLMLVLLGAVNFTSRPPRLLLPRDLRTEHARSGSLPFALDMAFVVVGLIAAGGLVLWLYGADGWGSGAARIAGIICFSLFVAVMYEMANLVADRIRERQSANPPSE